MSTSQRRRRVVAAPPAPPAPPAPAAPAAPPAPPAAPAPPEASPIHRARTKLSLLLTPWLSPRAATTERDPELDRFRVFDVGYIFTRACFCAAATHHAMMFGQALAVELAAKTIRQSPDLSRHLAEGRIVPVINYLVRGRQLLAVTPVSSALGRYVGALTVAVVAPLACDFVYPSLQRVYVAAHARATRTGVGVGVGVGGKGSTALAVSRFDLVCACAVGVGLIYVAGEMLLAFKNMLKSPQ